MVVECREWKHGLQAVQPHMLKSTFHRASLHNKLANIITESEQGGKLPYDLC